MIIETELQRWLNDRTAHRGTSAAADEFARSWTEGASHIGFDAAFATLGQCSANAVANAARDLFADDFWLDALVAGLAEAMRHDRYFEPPFRALHSDIHTGLLVYEDDHVTVTAGVSRIGALAQRKSSGGKGSIHFSGQLSVLKFLKAGGARLAFWEADPIGSEFSAATAGQCRPTGVRAIADGEVVMVDGHRQSYVIDHATTNLLVLQAAVKTGQAPVGVEYDSATRAFLGCSAVDESDCRIQMIATLARKLGHPDAFASIAAFLDHPSFFVRWHVMKELLGIDTAAALPHLKRMAARDPHPDPRAAARSVLDRIEAAPHKRKAA